jgi:hypothetical protein
MFSYTELDNFVFAIYRRDGEGSGTAPPSRHESVGARITSPGHVFCAASMTASKGDLDGFSIA